MEELGLLKKAAYIVQNDPWRTFGLFGMVVGSVGLVWSGYKFYKEEWSIVKYNLFNKSIKSSDDSEDITDKM